MFWLFALFEYFIHRFTIAFIKRHSCRCTLRHFFLLLPLDGCISSNFLITVFMLKCGRFSLSVGFCEIKICLQNWTTMKKHIGMAKISFRLTKKRMTRSKLFSKRLDTSKTQMKEKQFCYVNVNQSYRFCNKADMSKYLNRQQFFTVFANKTHTERETERKTSSVEGFVLCVF